MYFNVQLQLLLRLSVIRSLSPELQEDVLRVLANGNLILKAAKPFMPGIAGLGARTGLSQPPIAGLPAGLNSQVQLLQIIPIITHVLHYICCHLSIVFTVFCKQSFRLTIQSSK